MALSEGSYPREFCYGEAGEEEESEASGGISCDIKPRILLMGLKRSGKSSIYKVVFFKTPPNDTLFLETTPNIVKEDIANSTFIQFQIWDFPGQIDILSSHEYDLEMIFGSFGAVIFVIDAVDDYLEALTMLRKTLNAAYKINPMLDFEVFIHKVDGISEDIKMELQRDIMQSVSGDLTEDGLDELRVTYHLTSIYDHSIYEAFSKVVQKVIPQLPTLENLLDSFIMNSGIEKVFIFDVISKIYIATDSSPVEMQSYELCCDMIDVVLDVSCIYGAVLNYISKCEVPTPADYMQKALKLSKFKYLPTNLQESEDEDNSGFDSESSSTIKLNNQTVLYLREVNRHLALICILRAESFERRGVIDYNFMCLRKAIKEVFSIGKKVTEQPAANSTTDRPGVSVKEITAGVAAASINS